MNGLIDTHTHLYLPEFESDVDDVMSRAVNSGVKRMIFPNVDPSTIGPMKALHKRYPLITSLAMGLHPTEVNADWKNSLDTVISEFGNENYIAVGEIGMDLYWDSTFEKEQMEVLEKQIEIAVGKDLPIIIHCRNALPQTLEVLEKYKDRVRGVFHSFGGSPDDVERIRRVGDFYFGINGIVTFKNSGLRDTLPYIGIDRILLETDAPYLAPVPYRGKRNESSYLVHTAASIASHLGLDSDIIAMKTTHNAENLFGFRE